MFYLLCIVEYLTKDRKYVDWLLLPNNKLSSIVKFTWRSCLLYSYLQLLFAIRSGVAFFCSCLFSGVSTLLIKLNAYVEVDGIPSHNKYYK